MFPWSREIIGSGVVNSSCAKLLGNITDWQTDSINEYYVVIKKKLKKKLLYSGNFSPLMVKSQYYPTNTKICTVK